MGLLKKKYNLISYIIVAKILLKVNNIKKK